MQEQNNPYAFNYRKQHIDDIHSGRRCKCYKCAKELKNYKSLEGHLKLVHGIDPSSQSVTSQKIEEEGKNSEDRKHEEYSTELTCIDQE